MTLFKFFLDEDAKLSEAGALPPENNMRETDEAIAVAMAATMNGDIGDIEIDEDLFDGEDLDQVEEDLDTLDLDDWPCDNSMIW